MTRFAIACSALFFLSFHATAQTYLNSDFSNGIPADFILVDLDGNTPSSDMQKQGFAVGTPWISCTPSGETGAAVAATSWYSPAGTSSDWLITPAFTLDHSNVTLSWRSRSRNKRTHNAYSVYVSTDGGALVSDFDTATPLFTSTDEPNTWTKHSISLSAYEGKNIRLAFVENSTDKDMLYLDDILVAVHSDISIKTRLGNKIHTIGETIVNADVTNTGEAPISGFDVSLTADGETTTQHFSNTIEPDSSITITLDKPLTLVKHEKKAYQLSVSAAGNSFAENDTVVSYQRKSVIEEITGTWCLWCVRGIVALQNLREEASDKFIGIAVHHNDIMETDHYDNLHSRFDCNSLPTGIINRKGAEIDPLAFAQEVNTSVNEKAIYSDMTLTADVEGNTINSKTNIIFGADEAASNYKLAYVVVENNVHHPDNKKYAQENAYSGGANGEMGGWEKLPSVITCDNMWFNEVARYYDGEFYGNNNLIPSAIKAEQLVSVERTFTIPENAVDNINNCELIVMLIDGSNSQIVNAEKVKLNPNAEEPIDVAARMVDGVEEINHSENTSMKIFSISGVQLQSPNKGINIIGGKKIIFK